MTNNIVLAPLDNYIREVQINRIIDGDTFVASVDLGYSIKTDVEFRLSGLNTQNMSTEKGKEAYEIFFTLCENASRIFVESEMLVKTPYKMKREKWRRYLATVYFFDQDNNWINLNERLLNLGLAMPYKGIGPRD
jgi:endonuclease YncB( thermonuclease family)